MLQSFTWKESAVAKSVRERNFPISFLLRGLHVRLEDGEATVTEAGHKAASWTRLQKPVRSVCLCVCVVCVCCVCVVCVVCVLCVLCVM